MKVADAVEQMVSAMGDLELIARGLPVDGAEVAAALSACEQDSAEAVALRLLAKYNPAPAKKPTTKES